MLRLLYESVSTVSCPHSVKLTFLIDIDSTVSNISCSAQAFSCWLIPTNSAVLFTLFFVNPHTMKLLLLRANACSYMYDHKTTLTNASDYCSGGSRNCWWGGMICVGAERLKNGEMGHRLKGLEERRLSGVWGGAPA